jgi:AGZA family xanthine/uracil permease-like MFS transporter
MVLGAIAAFVIDRDLNRAAVAALSGAVLSFVGLINTAGPVGWNVSPAVTLGYLMMAATFGVVSWRAGHVSVAGSRPLAAEKAGGD